MEPGGADGGLAVGEGEGRVGGGVGGERELGGHAEDDAGAGGRFGGVGVDVTAGAGHDDDGAVGVAGAGHAVGAEEEAGEATAAA